MKHVWSILCQESSIDSESNLLSLFKCVEEISLVLNSTEVPKDKKHIVPLKFQLVSFWTTENTDVNKDKVLEIKLDFLDPDKKVLSHFEKKINVKKGSLRFRNRININGLPITKEGRYVFNVLKKKSNKKDHELVAKLPIDVKIDYKLDFNKK